MGKGAGGCDEREPILVGENAKPLPVLQKLNSLKKTGDKALQTEEGQELIQLFEGLAAQDWALKIEGMFAWITREWKRGGIILHDGKLKYMSGNKRRSISLPTWAAWHASKDPTRKGLNIMDKSVDIKEINSRIKEYRKNEQARILKEKQKKAAQGEKIFEFEDGWSIQRLTNAQQLDWEGQKMNFCLGNGGYDDSTENELILVFSVRDPQGKPHATMDVTPRWMRRKEDGWIRRYPKTSNQKNPDWFKPHEWEPQFEHSSLNSFYGPADSVPKDKYKARVKEWMDSCGAHRIRGNGNAEPIKEWDEVMQLAANDEPGYRTDDSGFLLRSNVSYDRFMSGLLKVEDADEQAEKAAALQKLAELRGEKNGPARGVRKLASGWLYTDGPDSDWEISHRRERVTKLCEMFEMEEPEYDKLVRGVASRALKEKKKGDLARSWRHAARDHAKAEKEQKEREEAAAEPVTEEREAVPAN